MQPTCPTGVLCDKLCAKGSMLAFSAFSICRLIEGKVAGFCMILVSCCDPGWEMQVIVGDKCFTFDYLCDQV